MFIYMPYKRRYVRRRVKKAVKKPTRRVTTVARLAKKVRTLQRNFKPELKELVYTNGSSNVYIGQVIQNTAGFYASDVTPSPTQGATYQQRIGSTIRLKHFRLQYQLIAQSNYNQNCMIKMLLVRVKGAPVTPSSFVNDMYNPNPFIYNGGVNAGIVDATSLLNQDYKKNYQVVKSKTIRIPIENYANSIAVRNGVLDVWWKTPMEILFDGNTQNLMSGQLILILLANSGNYSISANSTLSGIPVTTLGTGFNFNTNLMFEYYDQ